MGVLGVQWWQHQSNHNSTKVRASFSFDGSLATVRGLFCRRWRNVRVRGLFGPSGINGRVKGLLGVQWWQHQSNQGILPKLRHLFASIEVLPQLGDFFVALGEMYESGGFLGLLESNGRVMGLLGLQHGGSIRVIIILPKLGHHFSFYLSLATVRGLFWSRSEKCKSQGAFWAF